MSDDLVAMRRRKEVLEKEIQRFAAAIAHGGPLDSLVQEIATREAELKGITTRLLSSSATSIDGQLCEIRQFVEKGISDLRGLLNQDAALAKSELHSHLSEIRMTATEDRKEWHYVAEGNVLTEDELRGIIKTIMRKIPRSYLGCTTAAQKQQQTW